ncbi:MAG TPA: hypothetical protein VJK48_03455 [Chlamydiales bacterium]|nr:hypothetical protein [Chlamydiales bacterium]
MINTITSGASAFGHGVWNVGAYTLSTGSAVVGKVGTLAVKTFNALAYATTHYVAPVAAYGFKVAAAGFTAAGALAAAYPFASGIVVGAVASVVAYKAYSFLTTPVQNPEKQMNTPKELIIDKVTV